MKKTCREEMKSSLIGQSENSMQLLNQVFKNENVVGKEQIKESSPKKENKKNGSGHKKSEYNNVQAAQNSPISSNNT